jgi:hypothetical protein
MSKHETPITRWYWQKLGGLLVEEYCLIERGAHRRLADAIVLPERETRLAHRGEQITIAPGERVVVLQTKDARLGMYLMGQTLFSAKLLRDRFPEAKIESVALCTTDDAKLRPLLEAHTECRVVVAPQSLRRQKQGRRGDSTRPVDEADESRPG